MRAGRRRCWPSPPPGSSPTWASCWPPTTSPHATSSSCSASSPGASWLRRSCAGAESASPRCSGSSPSRRSRSSPARSSGASTATACTTCRSSSRRRTGSSSSPASRSPAPSPGSSAGSPRPRSAAATIWALLGLTVLDRTDLAGAAGVPLLLVFLAGSRNRGALCLRVLHRRRARALRHGDRHLALGRGTARARHPGRKPALGRRLRLRLVRRHGAGDGTALARTGPEAALDARRQLPGLGRRPGDGAGPPPP